MTELRLDGVVSDDAAGDGGPTLDGVDLVVPAGEVVAIVADDPPAATALLRTIAGLVPVRAGRIMLGGVDVAALPPAARGVALVYGGGLRSSRLTVGDHLAAVSADRDRVRAAAHAVGLTDTGVRLRALSPLDRQLVALARAHAAGAAVLLLDEPAVGLDADDAARLGERVRALGRTALWATRDWTQGALAASRLAVVTSGRITSVEDTAALRADPPTLAAALAFEPSLVVVRVEPDATALPLPAAAGGRRVVDAAIRRARLDATGVGRDDAGLDGAALEGRAITSDGDVLYVSVPGLAEPLTARVPGALRLVGFRVRVLVDAADVLVFDPDTGRRLRTAISDPRGGGGRPRPG